jgi:hypothetical protein
VQKLFNIFESHQQIGWSVWLAIEKVNIAFGLTIDGEFAFYGKTVML